MITVLLTRLLWSVQRQAVCSQVINSVRVLLQHQSLRDARPANTVLTHLVNNPALWLVDNPPGVTIPSSGWSIISLVKMGAEQSKDTSTTTWKKTETANFDFRFDRYIILSYNCWHVTILISDWFIQHNTNLWLVDRAESTKYHAINWRQEDRSVQEKKTFDNNCNWTELGCDVVKRIESQDKLKSFYSRW